MHYATTKYVHYVALSIFKNNSSVMRQICFTNFHQVKSNTLIVLETIQSAEIKTLGDK